MTHGSLVCVGDQIRYFGRCVPDRAAPYESIEGARWSSCSALTALQRDAFRSLLEYGGDPSNWRLIPAGTRVIVESEGRDVFGIFSRYISDPDTFVVSVEGQEGMFSRCRVATLSDVQRWEGC